MYNKRGSAGHHVNASKFTCIIDCHIIAAHESKELSASHQSLAIYGTYHLHIPSYCRIPPDMAKEHSGRKSRARRKMRRRRRIELQRLSTERNAVASRAQKDYGSEGSDSSQTTERSSSVDSDATSDSDTEPKGTPAGSDPESKFASEVRAAATKKDAPKDNPRM